MDDDEKRINEAIAAAQEAFWATIAAQFPEATSGDLSPDAAMAFDAACTTVVTAWVASNAAHTG